MLFSYDKDDFYLFLCNKKIEDFLWEKVGKTEQGKPRLVLFAYKDALLRSSRWLLPRLRSPLLLPILRWPEFPGKSQRALHVRWARTRCCTHLYYSRSRCSIGWHASSPSSDSFSISHEHCWYRSPQIHAPLPWRRYHSHELLDCRRHSYSLLSCSRRRCILSHQCG